LKTKSVSGHLFFYDTFDWRLYNRNLRFFQFNQQFSLESQKDPTLKISVTSDVIPRFVTKIQSERVRSILEPIVEFRALLQVVHLRLNGKEVYFLDDVRKTVARGLLRQVTVVDDDKRFSLPWTFSVIPVRGYDKAYTDLLKWCVRQDVLVLKTDLLEQVLQTTGTRPGEYSSKIHSDLDPAMPATQATQKILAQLLHIIQLNEAGVAEDIDIEFLHDYRVSVRRIRSLFGQIKNVFHKEIYQQAKDEFSEIGRFTNKMRDIDVYLIREETYKNMLPAQMRGQIDLFFNDLKKNRESEHRKILEQFASLKYRKIVNKWVEFTEYPLKNVATSNGKQPVLAYAQQAIRKRYLKIISLGNKIGPDTADSYLHQLRIECKKLRYLLEFFMVLFPRQKMNMLIRHLKKLQDNLGAFNDLSVQQSKLHDFADTVTVENDKETLLAIGILIGRLNQEQMHVREKFDGSYRQFVTTHMLRLFEQLFASKVDEGNENNRNL
jgi:CHAD domain-containing protein